MTEVAIERIGGAKEFADKRGNLLWFSLDKTYVAPGWNLRTPANVERRARELMSDIRENGVLEPLFGFFAMVDGVRAVVLDNGHCRREAVRLLKEEEGLDIRLPFLMSDTASNEVDRLASQFSLNNSEGLSLLEQAEGLKRFLKYGLSEAEVAKKIGKSVVHVKNCLKLLSSTPEVQQLVAEGKVAATTAIGTIKSNPAQAEEILREAVVQAESEGKSKATAKHVKKTQEEGAIAAPKPAKGNLRSIVLEVFSKSPAHHLEDSVQLTIDRTQWQQLNSLLGIEA